MQEIERLQDIVKSCEESLRLFSNAGKCKRDVWVVNEFLTNLEISFENDEIKPLINNDPPDVIFRNAKFEIKEVDKENRKRHDEYKRKLEKAKSVTSSKNLVAPYEFKEIALREVVNRIHERLKECIYATDFRKEIDILFYINYSLIGDYLDPIPENDIWRQWRSVSMVTNNNISCVFWAASTTPEFIKSIQGKGIIRNR